jgi:alpha-glucosidase
MGLEIIKEKEAVRLIYSGREVFRHSDKMPVLKFYIGKLVYSESRGNFKVKEKINREIIPMLKSVDKGTDAVTLIFEAEGQEIKLFSSIKGDRLIITLEAKAKFDAVAFTFTGVPGGSIYGLGERFRRLNHKGRVMENMVAEHITLKPILLKSIPPFNWFKHKPREEVATYAPMSVFISSEKYAIKVVTGAYGVEDFSVADRHTLRYWGIPEKIEYLTAKSYKELSERMSEARPYLPDWALDGMILGIQGGIDYAASQAEKMIAAGAKINGVWCQDWSGKKITVAGKQVYWNWEYDKEMYPELKNRIGVLKKKGVRFLGYINPYLIEGGAMYNYCRDRGYLVKNVDNTPYSFKTTTFPAGMMDLTHPEMVSFLKKKIIKENMLDLGISGWMADFGEYLPAGLKLYNGKKSEDMHNEWPTLWTKLNREAIEEAGAEKEAFFYTRSAYNGAARYAPIMWNGDQHTDYSLDYGMGCVVPASINLGMSGMPLVHSDIAGYITFGSLFRDDELFVRWMSMNTFSPLMRTHETTRPEENIQYDGAGAIKYSVFYSNIHSMLKPYIKSVIEEAKRGVPAMRAPFYQYNDHALANGNIQAYIFGNDIFVSPVMAPGIVKTSVELPNDKWVHLFTGESFNGGKAEIDCPLDMPPVFYRADSHYTKLFKRITEYIKEFKF